MAPNLAKGALDVLGPLPDGDEKLTSPITLEASTFFASGHPILRNVPTNVVATPSPLLIPSQTPTSTGCFVGFEADEPRSHHVVPIGQLMGIRFTSIFRFKVWWTTHWTGNDGNDVENETQVLILDRDEKMGRPYVLLLPIIEGPFRACLQSGKDNHVAMCVESGSTRVVGSSFRSCLYMQVGDDPFDLVRDAMKAVRVHLGTFKLLEEKSPPGMVDKFGWCTWDAFYLKVHPKGIWEGVKGLEEGGCPPGFVLIDDGWQSIRQDKDRRICGDEEEEEEEEGMDAAVVGEQMPCRLASFQENSKFKEYTSRRNNNTSTGNNEGRGMGAFVRDLKEEFKSIEHVYVWHAFLGYWGGIRPNVSGMPDSRVVVPKLSQGLQMTMKDLAVDRIVDNGVGLVSPQAADQMYEGLHSHLESVGIDGVKVDVIHLLEMLSEDYGGRVELAKAYYKALTASINKHFKGNGAIASMEHCNDFMLLGTEAISLGRVGDDFWCSDPRGDPNGTYWLQGCHMVHCAYNSLWMGNFILPDWDMFQSTHPCAEFHAASRSISGGPIYVSDCVGQHNFELLKKLVLPDGSILRCRHYALPTRDCLFEDPLHDGKTLLKIWNLNRFTGVIGAFNCQGGGWCPTTRENKSAFEYSHPVAGSVSPSDVEWNKGNKQDSILIKGVDADALFAVYMFKKKKLELLRPTESIDLTLDCFDFELLTLSPVHVLDVVTAGGGKSPVQFAPIGLVNMLNSGGAIQDMEIDRDEGLVRVGVRGCGEMKVFVSERPKGCRINGKDADFVYDDARMATVYVSWAQGEPSGVSVIDYLFC